MDGIAVFVEVVDAQSFTRAASRLGMSTTTVSAQIARLEKRLGVTLIRRTTRKLHVTDAGQRYYNHCARVLAELAEAERELADAVAEPTGPLRITAFPDFAQGALMPVVERYLELYPKSSIELIVTRRQVDLISERVDLAVRVGAMDDSTLIVRKFSSAQLGLYAAPAYLARKGWPQSPADIAGHDAMSFSIMARRVLMIRDNSKSEKLEFELAARLSADDFGTLRAFLLRGNGIGMLPLFVGEGLVADGRLARLFPGYATEMVNVNFAYPQQTFVPRTVRAFMALAAQTSAIAQPPSRVKSGARANGKEPLSASR